MYTLALTRGMAAGKTFPALRHQVWLSSTQHLCMHLSVRETAVEVVWPWPVIKINTSGKSMIINNRTDILIVLYLQYEYVNILYLCIYSALH